MTSNVPPPSAASGGRRRALGRGPGTAPAPVETPSEPSGPSAEPPKAPTETPDGPRERPERPGGPETPTEPSRTPEGGTEPPAGPVERSAAAGEATGTAEAPPRTTEPREKPTEPPGTPQEDAEGPMGPEPPSEPSETPGGGPEPSAGPGTPEGLPDVLTERPEPVEGSETAVEPSGVPGEGAGPSTVFAGPVEVAVDRSAPSASPDTAVARSAAPGTASGPAPGSEVSPEGSKAVPADSGDGVFKVRLSNFEGPFDLLLQLISKHKLDVTEVALSKVTDEFMAHIRAMGPDWDLDQTTEFLVVAATLLDLKAARLLPTAEVEDEADLALLEARDLLFARLLQYRAYKQIADIFNARLEEEARRYPRTVGLEAQYAELLPEVVISIGAEGFARLAVKAMQPKPKPQVYVDHIHAPLVSVQEQAQIVVARLRELGEASFRSLVEDTDDTLTVVARFLALLELYREKVVALDQEEALGDLMVRWTGGEGDDRPRVTDEFDRPPEAVKEETGRGTKEEKA
ncbi:segregation/condensation protein A [Streptomyces sp. NPDC091209]|uniref:segregation and condensation protein A n=1 Tax=Streptomyces sp. NPDC091209 TaxID=3365974 RepID=UPI00381480CF